MDNIENKTEEVIIIDNKKPNKIKKYIPIIAISLIILIGGVLGISKYSEIKRMDKLQNRETRLEMLDKDLEFIKDGLMSIPAGKFDTTVKTQAIQNINDIMKEMHKRKGQIVEPMDTLIKNLSDTSLRLDGDMYVDFASKIKISIESFGILNLITPEQAEYYYNQLASSFTYAYMMDMIESF